LESKVDRIDTKLDMNAGKVASYDKAVKKIADALCISLKEDTA
jgi:hypothetical protein